MEKDIQSSFDASSHAPLATHGSLPPNFEQHTRGIGSKPIHTMGCRSGGLGKHGQGVPTPIELENRPQEQDLDILRLHYKIQVTLPMSRYYFTRSRPCTIY